MSNVFENIENYVKAKLFKTEGVKEGQEENQEIKVNYKDPEESSVLLDSNREKFNLHMENEELVVTIIPAGRLALMYGALSILLIVVLFSFSLIRELPSELFSEIGKIKYISFFDLQKINHFLFHFLNTLTSLLGFTIVYLLYASLSLKLNPPKTFELLLTTFYGFVSHTFALLYGMSYYIDGLENFDMVLHSELKISLNQFLFFLQLFFTSLYGIFILIIMNGADSKPSHCLEQEDIKTDNKWLTYQIIMIIYLICFSLSLVFIVLHSNKIIFSNLDSLVLKNNYGYLLCFLPYALYFLNAAFFTSFYSQIRESKINFSSIMGSASQNQKYNQNIL
jgi:hypothetical protein